jgi:hypothetical protein
VRRLIILIAALAVVPALPAVAPAKSDPGVTKKGQLLERRGLEAESEA